MTTIFLDGASFLFDAALSATLLTPATLDDGLAKTGIFVSVVSTNLIGFVSSGSRFTWAAGYGFFQICLLGAMVPLQLSLITFPSTAQSFLTDAAFIGIMIVIITLLESWGLNRMYVQAYENMRHIVEEPAKGTSEADVVSSNA